MSMNNQIIIAKRGKKYEMYDCCADEVSDSQDWFERYGCSLVGKYDDLEKAMNNQPESEYGARFIGEIKAI